MKNRSGQIIGLLVVWAVAPVFQSCGTGELKPAEVSLDEDTCSQCRMTVSQLQFAAQDVSKEGAAEFFDDIGCLREWLKSLRQPRQGARFVVDYNSGKWIPVDSAYFVQSTRVPTPMSYGIVAFSDRTEAEAFAVRVEGKLLSWNQLLRGDEK